MNFLNFFLGSLKYSFNVKVILVKNNLILYMNLIFQYKKIDYLYHIQLNQIYI